MSKPFKIIISIFVVAIVVLLSIGAWLWYAQSQMYVKIGFAQDKFPYRLFTANEMGNMYSQEPLEGIATTQTPEQTHAKFIEALKKGDIDGAVECCVLKSERENMREKLNRINNNKMFDLMLKDISIIEKESLYEEGIASYMFYGTYKGEKVGGLMSFRKNLQGVWMIESF